MRNTTSGGRRPTLRTNSVLENTSLGEPSATTFPASNTISLWQSLATSSMLWDTKITVIPLLCISLTVDKTPSRPFGSNPAAGSSRMSTFGFMDTTPAMATRLSCPPDSSKGDLSRSSGESPTISAASFTLWSISFAGSPRFLGPNAISAATVSSNTCCSGNWNTKPTFWRKARRLAPFSQISRPSTRTCPEVGFKSPFKCWIKVDLPEPVGPIKPTNSPSSMPKVMSLKA